MNSELAVHRSIPFIDTHVHMWELSRLTYPWLTEPGDQLNSALFGDYKQIRVDWGPRRLYRHLYGQQVRGLVHVEAACRPDQSLDETSWLAAVADRSGLPSALVVFCDLTQPNTEAILHEHLRLSTLTRGVRARPERPSSTAFKTGLHIAATLGLSFEFSASPGTLKAGVDLARAEPDLQIVIGHTGLPVRRDSSYRTLWRREMSDLSKAPNIAVKISGLGVGDHDWTVDSIRPWVLDTIEMFGINRCMFGTNWPVESLYSTYFELVDAYRRIISDAGFSAEDQAALLHANAERIYSLAPRPSMPEQPANVSTSESATRLGQG